MRWTKVVLLTLLVLAFGAAVVWAALPKPVPVDLGRVTRGPLVVTIDEDGRTRALERHVVSAPLGGNLLRIELDPGDPVAAGEVLARLLPSEPPMLDQRSRAEAEARLRTAAAARAQADAAVARARLALDLARRETERQSTLAARHSIAERAVELALFEQRSRAAELDAARSGLRAAASEVDTVRAILGAASARRTAQPVDVHAPIGGVVFRVLAAHAGPVAPGTPLVEVGDPQRLEIVTDLLTNDAVNVRPGSRVVVEGWGGARTLRGVVRRVEPSAVTRVSVLGVEEQRVDVVIDLLDPPSGRATLGDGFRVEVRIVTWERPDALQVSFGAPFRCDGAYCVFVRDAEGRASRRRVRLGHRSGDRVEVLGGLRLGDSVVLHPGEAVADGVELAAR